MEKPHSPACERNQESIVKVLTKYFNQMRGTQQILELGSGTGQHAVYFTEKIPQIQWQPSDVSANLPGIQLWVDEDTTGRVLKPIVFDLTQFLHSDFQRPLNKDFLFHHIYTANTFHIISKSLVKAAIRFAGKNLPNEGKFFLYGPFNYQGKFTASSNQEFHQWLIDRYPDGGIRDFEWINLVMQKNGLFLQHDHAMPANNRLLVYST